MAIAQTKFHVLRVLMQIDQNFTGLQRDMRNNANSWKAMANAQSPDITTLVSFMHDAATSYQTRLAWLANYKNTSPNWTAVTAMYTALGGDIAEATTLYNQMKAVADQLAVAVINTYADAISTCDQILAAVQAPDTLWPE